ncbi:hypothetical protein D3C76_1182850 [compost metagenome]
MAILHKPIEALRSGDPLQIADFEDLMPTKDQIVQMMNYDLARRADRSYLSLITQATIAPVTHNEIAAATPVSKPVVPVANEPAPTAHFAKGVDVQTQLEQRGWVDKESAW